MRLLRCTPVPNAIFLNRQDRKDRDEFGKLLKGLTLRSSRLGGSDSGFDAELARHLCWNQNSGFFGSAAQQPLH